MRDISALLTVILTLRDSWHSDVASERGRWACAADALEDNGRSRRAVTPSIWSLSAPLCRDGK